MKGQLERKKKPVEIRGLNRNFNHDLKNLFKGAAIVAATKPGPFAEFYAELVAKGTRPEMARLTLARKIATIVLIVWKRGVCFGRPTYETSKQLECVSERFRSISLGISLAVAVLVLETLWFESESQLVRLDAACFGHQVSHPTLGPLRITREKLWATSPK